MRNIISAHLYLTEYSNFNHFWSTFDTGCKLKLHRSLQGYPGTILPGVQSYWGEHKMYSECMEKVRRLMVNNTRKVYILQISILIYYKVKTPSKRCCRFNMKGSRSLRSKKYYFYFFHTNAFKFPCEQWIGFTDKYIENQKS